MPISRKPSAPDPGSLLAWQILAPITALFFVLLVASGFIARNRFEPVALQRDLARAERYAQFAAVVFGERLPQTDARKLSEEFWAAGLDTLEFLPPDATPEWTSPRFVAGGPFVDAWATVRTTDGQTLGAVSLRRQADAFILVHQTIISFAITSCVVFALLVALAWLLFKRRVTDRLGSVAREIAPAAQRAAPDADAIDEVRTAAETAQSQIRSREEPMQRLLKGHTEMACVSTPEGTILDVNEAYCSFFGKQRENLVGTNYLDLIPPPERADALASVQRLSRSNPVSFTEHRVLLPDGSTRWVRWRDTAVLRSDGTIKEILSYGTDISPEKILAKEIDGLKVAFDQMQSLAETGSLTWDFAKDRMEWTDETRRLLGVDASTPASIEGLLAVVAPDDREMLLRLFNEAKEQGRNFQHEFRAVLADGSLRVLQSRAEVMADPKTKLLKNLTCTLRDITTLRDAEAATKRELRFREAVENSLAVGIVVRDMKGCTLSANPAFTDMVGFSEQELIAAVPPVEPYWPDDQRQTIEAALAQALAGTAPKEGFQLVFNRRDQTRFDALVAVAPIRDDHGVPYAMLGAVTDISALQQVRRELQQTNERMRIAQDVVGLGIWDWDPVADTLFWDTNSFAMFGHPEATDPKKVWTEVHSEEERERLTYELKRLIEAGGENGQDRLRIRWPDGSEHNILSTYVILRDASGKANRVIGVNRDVTTELEQEQELRIAQERLFAALEGGKFGTFEHVFGLGAINWNSVNYEIHGIDPTITDPDALFRAWLVVVGDGYPAIEQTIASLPVDQTSVTYDFDIRLPCTGKKRRVRSSVFIERSKNGHPVRLVGVSRCLD